MTKATTDKAEHLQCPNCGGAVLYAKIERKGRGYWKPGMQDTCLRCGTACRTAIVQDRHGVEHIGAVYDVAQDDLQDDAVAV